MERVGDDLLVAHDPGIHGLQRPALALERDTQDGCGETDAGTEELRGVAWRACGPRVEFRDGLAEGPRDRFVREASTAEIELAVGDEAGPVGQDACRQRRLRRREKWIPDDPGVDAAAFERGAAVRRREIDRR